MDNIVRVLYYPWLTVVSRARFICVIRRPRAGLILYGMRIFCKEHESNGIKRFLLYIGLPAFAFIPLAPLMYFWPGKEQVIRPHHYPHHYPISDRYRVSAVGVVCLANYWYGGRRPAGPSTAPHGLARETRHAVGALS